ncbi:MAG: diguanylate cyclase [Sphingobium sp.]|nr:diguanylate cyclase [Sphingobium sp.]MCP5398323.1 diguanylate cyclase [Sphingomonas sp.]
MLYRVEPRLLPKVLIAGLLYFALAAITITLTSNGNDIATLWPANAVLVALMLLAPRQTWRSILVAGFLANIAANVVTRNSIIGPALFGISNMVEVFIVAWGLHAAISKDGILRRPTSLWRFLFWAGLAGPACSSVLGAATAWIAFDQPFMTAMITWYIADSLGLIVFAPFFFALFRGDFIHCFRSRTAIERWETLALQGLVLATTIGVFQVNHLPILFLVPLPIMLVTFRRGWLGTKMAVMIVAIVVTVSTVRGSGPIMLADMGDLPQVFFSQFYLAALLMMQMPVAAALASRAELIEQLAKSEESVHVLAEQSDILMLTLDRSGQFTKVVGAAQRMIGKTEAELLGMSFEALAPATGEKLASAFKDVIADDSFDQAIEFIAPYNPRHWREAKFRVLEADQLANHEVVITVQDITDRKQREGELVAQAHVDDMTGLLNRAGFTDKAQRQIAHARDGDLYLVMIDVDRFKLINDNLGHASGDAVLTAIAQQMKSHLRSDDTIGRLGGDEFAIILSHVDKDQAYEACNRLVASVAKTPVALSKDKSVNVNISCGMARWHRGENLEKLKHNADMALYEAKRRGRNTAVSA